MRVDDKEAKGAMPKVIRAALARFWELVDSDSVRPFIWLYYLPFLIWGFYGSLFAYPIDLISDVMDGWMYDLWVWMPIPATTAAMLGLWLRKGDVPVEDINATFLRQDWLGLRLQFGGHACMFAVLLVYEVTAIAAMKWGDPTISVFLISSYTIGCFLLALQCLRKMVRGWQLRESR